MGGRGGKGNGGSSRGGRGANSGGGGGGPIVQFENTLGRSSPARGFGRWSFSVKGEPSFSTTGSFKNAQKAAADHFRKTSKKDVVQIKVDD